MSLRLQQDPFRNETDLIKQIALFQRKAAKLQDCYTPHQRAMLKLYTGIEKHCRAELRAFQEEVQLTVSLV